MNLILLGLAAWAGLYLLHDATLFDRPRDAVTTFLVEHHAPAWLLKLIECRWCEAVHVSLWVLLFEKLRKVDVIEPYVTFMLQWGAVVGVVYVANTLYTKMESDLEVAEMLSDHLKDDTEGS